MEELYQKLIPYTDCSFAIARARRAESTALADWGRVLSTYTDLLVKGKIPPPEDGDRPFFWVAAPSLARRAIDGSLCRLLQLAKPVASGDRIEGWRAGWAGGILQ